MCLIGKIMLKTIDNIYNQGSIPAPVKLTRVIGSFDKKNYICIMESLNIADKLQLLPEHMRQEAEDFIDFLLTKINHIPDHVKEGIKKGQNDVMMGRLRTHDAVMSKYKKYL